MTTKRTSFLRVAGGPRLAAALTVASAGAAALPWGCTDHGAPLSPSADDGAPSVQLEAPGARARLDTIRRRFAAPLRVVAPPRFERAEGGALRARFTRPHVNAAGAPATVELPARSSGAVRVRDNASGLAVAFTLEGAGDASLAEVDGVALYAGALAQGGGDLVHLVTPSGTEDLVYFEREPATRELRYLVDTSGVAGLRVLADTLELLDAGGAPRLRVRPPYVLDAAGGRHPASLRVDGCAVDGDPRGPWGRPVTPPGSRSCSVVVAWQGAPVQYPALVDPTWEATTTTMLRERTYHTATLLEPASPASRVLITGGFGVAEAAPSAEHPSAEKKRNAISTAELYEPLSRTFALTGSLQSARGYHTATLVEAETASTSTVSWEVLIIGGSADQDGPPFSTVAAVERYDSARGIFEPVPGLEVPANLARLRHSATRFDVGKILVAGGSDSTDQALNTAYVYTAGPTPMFTPKTMLANRSGHAAVLLADGALGTGDVLLTGGLYIGIAQTSGEIFNATADAPEDATPGTFQAITGTPERSTFPTMLKARARHTATRLQDGRVLLAGGLNGTITGSIAQDGAEIFVDSVDGTLVRGFAKMHIPLNSGPRYDHAATLLPAGDVVVTGGLADLPDATPTQIASVDSYCPLTGMVTAYDDISLDGTVLPLAGHTATLVNAGGSNAAGRAILIAGGGREPTNHAELLSRGLGEVCGRDQDCASGHCVTGVCCNTACDGACQACRASDKQVNEQNGFCGKAKDGTPTTVNCVDGTRTESACRNGRSVPVRSASCAPFQCNEEKTDCATSCATSDQCDGDKGWCTNEPGVISVPDGCPAGNASTSSGSASGGSGTSSDSSASGSSTSSGGAAGVGIDPCYAPDGGSAEGTPDDAGTVDGGTGGAGGGTPSGTCVCKKPIGTACEANEQCLSGFCVDGFCCNEACMGQCEACDVEGANGICRTVGSSDAHEAPHPKSHQACDGEGECQGFCDGTRRDACTFPPEGKLCGQRSCVNGMPTSFACNQQHECVQQDRTGCTPYACDPVTMDCKQRCDSEEDCDEDGLCVNNECVPLTTPTCSDDGKKLRIPHNEDKPCTAFKCRGSACLTSCSSVNDCLEGFGCTSDGQCAPVPRDPPVLSSCTIDAPGTPTERSSWPVLAVALAAGLARARSRRERAKRMI
ncbi:kelch repeat-containing protein [Sorangium sp. So ce861]